MKELIVYGTEAKYIGEAAAKRGVIVTYAANKEEAARLLQKILQPGDVVLCKGSHSMAVDQVIPLVFGKEGADA